MEPETWYILEDGTAAHPKDVVMDEKGALRTKDGRAVAMRDSGVPRTTGNPSRYNGAEVQPEKPKAVYKTRETKAK